ncbi:MAG: hypothetical protein FJZ58_04925, partial [Chlamydiae bacterium]|nr:hypothetical protein [Chlamydiota bacterium]
MINVNSSPINPSTPSGDGSKEGWTNNPKVNQPDMLHTSGIIITNVQSDDVRSKNRGHSSKNTVATPMKMTARSTSSEELSSGSEGFNLSEVKGGSVLEKIKPYLPSMPSIRLPWSQQQGSASILVAEKITPQEDDIEKGDAIPPQPRFTPEDVKSAWKGIISSGYTVLPGIPIIILIGLGRGICKGFEAGKQYGGSLLGLMGWIPGMFYGMYEQYGDVRKEAEAFAENFTAKMNAEEDTAAKSAYVGVGTGLCCMGCALSLVGSALYSIVRSPVTLYEKYQERQGSSTKQAVETANKCCNDIQEKLRSVGSAEEAKKIRELFNQAKQLVKYASDHAKSVSPNYLIEKVMPVGDRLYGNDDAPIGLETSIQDTATSYLHQAKELINGLNSFLNRAEDATENLADLRDEMGEVHGSIRDSMNIAIAVALDPSLKKNVDALLKQADAALQKLDAKIEREKELWKGDKSVKGLEGLEVATKTPDTKVKEDLINSIMLYFSEEQQTQWVKENGQNVRGNTLLEQVTSIVNHMSPVTQREALDKVEKQARINTRLRSLIEFGANEEFYMDLAIESQKQQEKQEAIQARDKKFKEFASQKLTGAFAEGETSAIIKINDLTTWPDDKKAKWIERNKGDLVIPSTCTKLDD